MSNLLPGGVPGVPVLMVGKSTSGSGDAAVAVDDNGNIQMVGVVTDSNAAIGVNGAAAPGSSMQIGVQVAGNLQPLSATNPAPISYPTATRQVGQVKIAVTGTAVQISATSYTLVNGLVIYSKATNGAYGTTGGSGVTRTVDGTGNGQIIAAGASVAVCGGINLNTIYVNGTAGDIFGFDGN